MAVTEVIRLIFWAQLQRPRLHHLQNVFHLKLPRLLSGVSLRKALTGKRWDA
jgi:hypothetical protein